VTSVNLRNFHNLQSDIHSRNKRFIENHKRERNPSSEIINILLYLNAKAFANGKKKVAAAAAFVQLIHRQFMNASLRLCHLFFILTNSPWGCEKNVSKDLGEASERAEKRLQ